MRHKKRAESKRDIQPRDIREGSVSSCLERMRKRSGGSLGEGMKVSFEHALDSSEAAEVFTVWEMGDEEKYKAIVRNLKDSWREDHKYINAPSDVGFETGHTVTWVRLGVRWLIVWQDYNQRDFFKGEMFRANYQIAWRDKKGKVIKQWAAIKGPVETKAKYDNVAGNYLGGRQNDTLEVWTSSRDKGAIEALLRFDKIKVGDRTWRIHVRDDISNPNVVRLSCIEDFNNEYTEDVVHAIPDDTLKAPEQERSLVTIIGPDSIKEGFTRTYSAIREETGESVTGDWTVYVNGEERESYSETNEIQIKAGKFKDRIQIVFTGENGEEALANVLVIGLFG